MDDAVALSLSVDSNARVFVVGCDPIGALQAVIVVLQVATIETIMSEIEIRFAGSEGLGGMKLDDARLLLEFSTFYAWTSRDRVIIERMPTCLARVRQSVLVEVEKLDIHFYFVHVKFDRC